ncbi:hypothetical protein, partial [Geobacillus vulcani]
KKKKKKKKNKKTTKTIQKLDNFLQIMPLDFVLIMRRHSRSAPCSTRRSLTNGSILWRWRGAAFLNASRRLDHRQPFDSLFASVKTTGAPSVGDACSRYFFKL